MASKIKLTGVDAVAKQLRGIPTFMTAADSKGLATTVVKRMKSLISKGISTVKGGGFGGRMPKYKNPKRYPGKRKPARPVNLKLTGKQLRALKGRNKKEGRENVAEIFYSTQDARDKEQGHRDGANKQKKRPTIPEENRNEDFAVTIERDIIKKMDAAVKRYIKKTTK